MACHLFVFVVNLSLIVYHPVYIWLCGRPYFTCDVFGDLYIRFYYDSAFTWQRVFVNLCVCVRVDACVYVYLIYARTVKHFNAPLTGGHYHQSVQLSCRDITGLRRIEDFLWFSGTASTQNIEMLLYVVCTPCFPFHDFVILNFEFYN